ncbi:hypothetical protein HDV00_002266 [Rhizophlyctis rosea]|nr:hypothetical protein HDV00_002266 [Rhizophlyctis rosea]
MSHTPGHIVIPPSNVNDPPEILPLANEEPFTLDTFATLLRSHTTAKKTLILARLETLDTTTSPPIVRHFWYSAHQLNKVIFRKYGESGSYLFRLHAMNPLTNTEIVGDVQYFAVDAAGDKGFRDLDGDTANVKDGVGVQPDNQQASAKFSLPQLLNSSRTSLTQPRITSISATPSPPTIRKQTFKHLMQNSLGPTRSSLRIAELAISQNVTLKDLTYERVSASLPTIIPLPADATLASESSLVLAVTPERADLLLGEWGVVMMDPGWEGSVELKTASVEDFLIMQGMEFKEATDVGKAKSGVIGRLRERIEGGIHGGKDEKGIASSGVDVVAPSTSLSPNSARPDIRLVTRPSVDEEGEPITGNAEDASDANIAPNSLPTTLKLTLLPKSIPPSSPTLPSPSAQPSSSPLSDVNKPPNPFAPTSHVQSHTYSSPDDAHPHTRASTGYQTIVGVQSFPNPPTVPSRREAHQDGVHFTYAVDDGGGGMGPTEWSVGVFGSLGRKMSRSLGALAGESKSTNADVNTIDTATKSAPYINNTDTKPTPPPPTAPPPTYTATYLGTDDDYLRRAPLRAYFALHALDSSDALLFDMPSQVLKDAGLALTNTQPSPSSSAASLDPYSGENHGTSGWSFFRRKDGRTSSVVPRSSRGGTEERKGIGGLVGWCLGGEEDN